MLNFKNFIDLFLALLLLSGIVFFHEFGHYLFARLFNVHVQTFSIGVGSVFFKREDSNGVEWRFAFPLGGYIEIVEKKEDLLRLKSENKKINCLALEEIHPLKNLLISFAGPFFNFILFYILYFVTLMNVDFSLLNNDNKIEIISSVQIFNENEIKDIQERVSKYKINGLDVVKLSFKDSLILTFKKFINLLKGVKFNSENLRGPICLIQSILGSFVNENFIISILNIAICSLTIGICNLIPIPSLDGGAMLISFIEFCYGERLTDRIMMIINYLSIATLGILFIYVMWLDLYRLYIISRSQLC